MESVKYRIGIMYFNEIRNDSHPYVQINFILHRQGEAYIYQVIIPAVVLAAFNILVLFLDPILYERIVLLFINLFSHEVYLEQLHYM